MCVCVLSVCVRACVCVCVCVCAPARCASPWMNAITLVRYLLSKRVSVVSNECENEWLDTET